MLAPIQLIQANKSTIYFNITVCIKSLECLVRNKLDILALFSRATS